MVKIMLILDKKIIFNENELVKVFNKHYLNIIEKSRGQKPTNIAKSHSIDNDKQAVELICNSYRNHLSILKIKSNMTTKGNINNNTIFSPVSSDDVQKLLQQLNPRKVLGDDKIPPALIKIAAEPLSTPLSIRSSHPEVFLGKALLKMCSNFTGEHPCRSAISIKLRKAH